MTSFRSNKALVHLCRRASRSSFTDKRIFKKRIFKINKKESIKILIFSKWVKDYDNFIYKRYIKIYYY